jgi:hypothetical protein
MEKFERNTDFYYLYLHYYADADIKFVEYELHIYDVISKLLGIPEFDCKNLEQNNNTECCIMTEEKIVKKFITKCNHCVEECAMIERVRWGCNTCPVCGATQFDIKNLQQIITDMADMLIYCDKFCDIDYNDEEFLYAREQFTENYGEYWAWLN